MISLHSVKEHGFDQSVKRPDPKPWKTLTPSQNCTDIVSLGPFFGLSNPSSSRSNMSIVHDLTLFSTLLSYRSERNGFDDRDKNQT